MKEEITCALKRRSAQQKGRRASVSVIQKSSLMTKGQLLKPIYDESKEHDDDGNDSDDEEAREKSKKIQAQRSQRKRITMNYKMTVNSEKKPTDAENILKSNNQVENEEEEEQ